VRLAKANEPIETPKFAWEANTRGPKNHVLDEVHIRATWRIRLIYAAVALSPRCRCRSCKQIINAMQLHNTTTYSSKTIVKHDWPPDKKHKKLFILVLSMGILAFGGPQTLAALHDFGFSHYYRTIQAGPFDQQAFMGFAKKLSLAGSRRRVNVTAAIHCDRRLI